jgi:hypothetical protein
VNIHVEQLSSRNEDELISFLNTLGRTTPSILGYHYPFYRDMLVEIGVGQPVYLGARLNGRLVGLLPAFARRSAAGVVCSSLPYFGPNAGVLYSDKEARAEIHTALLQALLSRAEQDKALSCSIYTPLLFDEFDLYDVVMPQAIVVDKFTQYLDLETATWSKKINYDLRKAERLGVEISKEVTPERVETFYTIYQQNCYDHGIPLKPKKCVEFLVDEGILGKHTDIYFAFHRDEMIGGLLIIWSSLTASYYVPCGLASARTLQPGTLLIEQAVQDARARGIRIWNWESSPSRDSGVYRFKKKWGAIEGNYRIYVQTFQPREIFQQLGRDGILRHFPYYFVYPFDLL